jgi:hypothetical protein
MPIAAPTRPVAALLEYYDVLRDEPRPYRYWYRGI